MRLKDMWMLARWWLPGGSRASVIRDLTYQQDIHSLLCCLPEKFRPENVEAACKASGVHPDTLYKIAARGDPLPESFREALYGPNYAANRGKTL